MITTDDAYLNLRQWVQDRIDFAFQKSELSKINNWYIDENDTFTTDINQSKFIAWLLSDKKLIKLFVMLGKVEIEEYSIASIQQITTKMAIENDLMFDRETTEIKQFTIKFLNGQDLIINLPKINKPKNTEAFNIFISRLRELI